MPSKLATLDNQPPCRCGRAVEPPHCSSCGSGSIYMNLRASRVEVLSGTREKVVTKAFRCRRCGQLFYEDSACAAPPVKVGSAPRSKTELDRAVKNIDPKRLDAARNALAALINSRATGKPLSSLETSKFPSAPQSETFRRLQEENEEPPEGLGHPTADGCEDAAEAPQEQEEDKSHLPFNDIEHDGFFDRRRKK